MRRTPSARELAHRIPVRVEVSDGYSNLLLRALPPEMERRERALCTELVLGTLRWRGRLMLTSGSPRHLLGGGLPAPYHDRPRRPLLPPSIEDTMA